MVLKCVCVCVRKQVRVVGKRETPGLRHFRGPTGQGYTGLTTMYRRSLCAEACWQHGAGHDEYSAPAAVDFITVITCKATSQNTPVRTLLL